MINIFISPYYNSIKQRKDLTWMKQSIEITITLIVLMNLFMMAQCNVVWEIETCRITTQSNGDFLQCQQQVDCANQTTGSRIDCSVYTYTSITLMSTCISTCCFGLSPVPTNLTGPLIQQCYNQYQTRKTLFIVKIVVAVIGSIIVVVGGIAIYLFAFVRNPYTGKKVYVGCWCCKKIADFQQDREKHMKSQEQLDQSKKKDALQEHQKKINKIQIA